MTIAEAGENLKRRWAILILTLAYVWYPNKRKEDVAVREYMYVCMKSANRAADVIEQNLHP